VSHPTEQDATRVSIAFGIFSGATCSIALPHKRIGAASPTPGVRQCRPPIIEIPINEVNNVTPTGAPGILRFAKPATMATPQVKNRDGFIVNAKDTGDPTNHLDDVAAGRNCVALFDCATTDEARCEYLASAGINFTAASRKLAAKARGKTAHGIRFAK
jgi:hypothetical protein